MSIAVLCITDGHRPYIETALPSFNQLARGDIAVKLIYEDSGNPDVRYRLSPYGFDVHSDPGPVGPRGYDVAVGRAWELLRQRPEPFTHVFHLEDDFVFHERVDLDAIAAALDDQPHLAQLVLRRQPWSRAEVAAGGVLEMNPDWYHDRYDGVNAWMEHNAYWSNNPCMYRRSLIDKWDWPQGASSEGHFGVALRDADPLLRFGFWGSRNSKPVVQHIGDVPAIGMLR